MGFILGALVGFIYAHSIIATECDRLGGFYYNQKTYKCVLSNPNKENR